MGAVTTVIAIPAMVTIAILTVGATITTTTTVTATVIRTALLLRVVAPSKGEILAPTVRGVLYVLHDFGMEFGKISYDSWGSHESIQILQSQGYEAEHLSVDTATQPYATLKEAIYDGRLLC